MKKIRSRTMAFPGLAVFALLVFTGFHPAGVFAEDNAYDFKLLEPQSHSIDLEYRKPVAVKISFNSEKVNAAGGYIATFVDGKPGSTGFGTTDRKSPFEDTLKAKFFKNGRHRVEYVLLPSGSMEKEEALAELSLNLSVSGSFNDEDMKIIDVCVKNLAQGMGKNDAEAVAGLCINKKKAQAIKAGIKGNTKQDEISKEALEELGSDEFPQRAGDSFRELREMLRNNTVDMTALQFSTHLKSELQNSFPSFRIIQTMSGFETKNHRVALELYFLVTKDKAYLIELDPESYVLEK